MQSSLELLLLALVSKGLATTYSLREKVGLSVGVTGQALRRLKSAGLLTSKRGARSSQRFDLTSKGQKRLKEGWQDIVTNGAEISPQAVIRIVYLAWLFNDLEVAAEYVKRASQELRFRAKQYTADADQTRQRFRSLGEGQTSGRELSTLELAAVYRWIQGMTDATIAEHEADALEAAVDAMKKLSPPPKARAFQDSAALPEDALRHIRES